jgi:ABC-type antimicrobial peptide transport system permease subunit
MGVRAALGARPGAIRALVVRQGTGLIGIGLALGMGGALLGGRLLEGLLYGVAPHDPQALLGAGALLLVVGVVACLVPAWRASRVDPARALRAE